MTDKQLTELATKREILTQEAKDLMVNFLEHYALNPKDRDKIKANVSQLVEDLIKVAYEGRQ